MFIASFPNPSYSKGIFQLIGGSPTHAKEVNDVLSQEYMVPTSVTQGKLKESRSSPSLATETPCQKSIKMYKSVIKCTPESSNHSNNLEKVIVYLQHHYPIMEDEDILSYWKCQILTGKFLELGKIALQYLSLPSSSACIEKVFSQSDHLITPTHAQVESKTIAHLCCFKEWLNSEKQNAGNVTL
ncbi:hypothetical protein O181_015906 [Austropuccinia psidii MF-1]|uniref:HAT C-terminal dimerisation domain-containing protein n=1 Tax=Austropuccinia psidii MF-1 TaxID=1389203 RepID=A0A9Q3C0Q5_9BASI|nr:hypothetical protein [Austropuccinia psidii MF-1]